MERPEHELDQLKRLDLRVIAGELGYTINTKRSSRGSAVMDHQSGDRILVAVASDGHFVWCSVHEPASGSCIDLWQRHRGGSLGEVRRALRPFLGSPGSLPPSTPPLPSGTPQGGPLPALQPIHRDILGVRARYDGFQPLGSHHAFLCEERRLPPEILALPGFAERIRVDGRGNAIFPHYNRDGLCGWEARNRGFMSFAKGGVKGLWCSVPAPTDRRLVIAESAIDALSHAALFGQAEARYISFSGGLNNEQPALLGQAMEQMPPDSTIVAAVDNDDAGDAYIVLLQQIYAEVGRGDLSFEAGRPPIRGSDWNDVLRDLRATPRPAAPAQPP
ncbi:MAG: DUF3991 and TOPRIM domain-containing protein [Phycisphaerales bacterium]|nr:DUF3991 and TOPRIM domain-containing protein [Phycisphaerales bacterium]